MIPRRTFAGFAHARPRWRVLGLLESFVAGRIGAAFSPTVRRSILYFRHRLLAFRRSVPFFLKLLQLVGPRIYASVRLMVFSPSSYNDLVSSPNTRCAGHEAA
jgi:hypothetical protein